MNVPDGSPRLQGRKLILGVSGGIAAYKSAELTRLFVRAGAEVQVVLTRSAERFIPALTLGTLSRRSVLVDVFPEHATDAWTQHVDLGLWADLMVVAPATAHTLAKLAGGFCDNMLTAIALAARCPVLLFPAMDHDMYRHPATQQNLERLRALGYGIAEPEWGELASGLVGTGRLPEPETIFARVAERLAPPDGPLAGRTVLVSAGPTREPLDPVRYLTNHSSGTMGFALAEAAAARGARVTLVSGPTALATPPGVERVDVVTADDMCRAVLARADADLVVMAAAVADYTPFETSPSKIKKQDTDLVLRLRRTTDILAEVGRQRRADQVLVGFALETDDGLENARAKLRKKNLDWIVLNNPKEEGAGFGPGTNRVTLIGRDGAPSDLPRMDKRALAGVLLDRVYPAPPPA